MKKTCALILLFVCMAGVRKASAQEDLRPVIEEILDNIAGQYEEGVDLSEITDRLYDLYSNPIHLNQADASQLAEIPLLSGYQINQLLDYRKRYGRFASIFELQGVEGLDRKTIQLIQPFVTLEDEEKVLPGQKRIFVNHDLMIRTSRVLQQQKGYISDSLSDGYLGGPMKNYMRYIVKTDFGEAGFTADKDAGEAFFEDPNASGFDFYSAHLYLEDLGFLKKLSLGDYSLTFGQGLNLWSGFTMGKSNPVSGAKKLPYGIRPYRSATEGGFFRGAATTLQKGRFSLSTFYSNQKLDGNKVYNADSSEYHVTSVDIGGYHRTPNELEDENSLKETLYGMNTTYNHAGLHFGLTAFRSEFDHDIIPQPQLYNKFRFSGDEHLVKGADFSWTMKYAEFFGEMSLDSENDLAWLAGANFYLHPRLMMFILHRDYDKAYNNLYAAATGEYSHSNNEQGWLYGLKFDVHQNWVFNGYIDFFSSEWLNYGSESPSTGKEMEARVSFIPDRDNSAYLRFYYEEKEVNSSSDFDMVQQTARRKRSKLRFHFSKTINQLDLRSRIESSLVKLGQETSKGFLFYQDIIYSFDDPDLKVYGRYAFFETDDYASRIYAYENDVLYAFSFPAYYYKGSRYFLMLSYKWKRMSFWLRYASTSYRDRDVVLSGLNEIDGSKVSELKFQVRVKF